MSEKINKEFDNFQEELRKAEMGLREIVVFNTDDAVDQAVEDLKKKEVLLYEAD